MAGKLELYVRIPSLSSVIDTEIYVYYGNAGAAETNDADTWNADYGVVYHLKEDPAGTAPQAKDSTANAVHGTYDIAGATVEANTLWGGSCILFDNGPRLLVADNPRSRTPIGSRSRTWVNTLSWPTRAVVCRKDGSYILCNYNGGFTGPFSRVSAMSCCSRLSGATSSAPMTRTPAPTTSASISTAPGSPRWVGDRRVPGAGS